MKLRTLDQMLNTLAQPSYLDNLPAELTAGGHFSLWHRPKQGGKKSIQALTGRTAHSDVPEEFTTFDVARRAFENNTYLKKGIQGVARRIVHQTDGMWALDIDNCVDPETGELNAYARMLVDSIGSYAEYTPSGRGIRIFGYGKLPYLIQRRGSVKIWIKGTHPDYPDVEAQLFIHGQYVTVTGNQIPGTPNFVATNQEFIDALLRSNPKKHYFGDSGASARQEVTTPKPGKYVEAPAIADGCPNYKRVNSHINHMLNINETFYNDWFKKTSVHPTESENQYALVKHYYVRYQPCKADIRFMLETWCKMWGLEYEKSRLNSWMRDAHIAYANSGRVSYLEYEAKRLRDYRANKKIAKLAKQAEKSDKNTPTTNMSGLVRNAIRLAKGERKAQVLVMIAASDKSYADIAKDLGISKGTVQSVVTRHRAEQQKLAVPEAQPLVAVEQTPAVAEPQVIEPTLEEAPSMPDMPGYEYVDIMPNFTTLSASLDRRNGTKPKLPHKEDDPRKWGFTYHPDLDLVESGNNSFSYS